MTLQDEQQQRHAVTMAFFQSAENAWQEIKELLKAEDEERRTLERDCQGCRFTKPVESGDE